MTQHLPPPPAGPAAGGPPPSVRQQAQPGPPATPGWRKRHPKLFWTLVVIGALIVLSVIGSILNPPAPPADEAAKTTQPAAASSGSATKGKAASKPAATSQAPAAPAKSGPGLGDEARDGKFAFVVHKIKCGVGAVGTQYVGAKAQGQFCLVSLTVKNIGDEPQTMFSSNQYAFRGDTKYSVDDTATLYAAKNADSPWIKEINPGNSLTGTLVFDVPKNIKLDKLELHDSAFSGGVSMSLS
jgi:hypothetical protein